MPRIGLRSVIAALPGPKVIKLEFIIRLKKEQSLAVCGHVSASSQSLGFILSLRLYSSFIASRPGLEEKNSLRLSRSKIFPLYF